MAAISMPRARRFPGAPEPWIDLSTGINPLPFSVPELPAEIWSRLPTRAEEEELLAAAATAYRVSDDGMIVAAPGTQALIQLLPRLVPKSHVEILGPTYEEHEVLLDETWAPRFGGEGS